MKSLTIACLFAIPFLAGWSTTYTVPRISDADEFVDAQAQMHGRSATVTLVDGTEIRLDSTSVHSDAVVGVKMDTHIRQEFPISQVKEIAIRHLGRGARRGVVNGFMWDGALGLALGATARTDPT